MSVEETRPKGWEVEASGVGGRVLARPSGCERLTINVEQSAVSISADDFSKWSTLVLANLRKDGWSPKRRAVET